MLRDIALLGTRSIVGGYLAAHGAQKLFGAFGGGGLDGTGKFFERVGLEPGREMAAAAGASELAGGALTVLGHLHPAGPLAIASTMGVAASTAHRGKGPFAQEGGPELPLTNLAASLALAACGPGRLAVGKRLPGWLGLAVAAAGAYGAYTIAQRAVATQQAEQDTEPSRDTSDTGDTGDTAPARPTTRSAA